MMEIIYKIIFGIAFALAIVLFCIKLIIPGLSLWIVFSPLIFLAAIVIFIGLTGAFFELFKIILNWVIIFLIIYIFLWIFIL